METFQCEIEIFRSFGNPSEEVVEKVSLTEYCRTDMIRGRKTHSQPGGISSLLAPFGETGGPIPRGYLWVHKSWFKGSDRTCSRWSAPLRSLCPPPGPSPGALRSSLSCSCDWEYQVSVMLTPDAQDRSNQLLHCRCIFHYSTDVFFKDFYYRIQSF